MFTKGLPRCAWLPALAIAISCHDSSSSAGGRGSLLVFAGMPSGEGNLDGTGAAASFDYPCGLAVDGSGNLYVADRNNHTIRRVTPAGAVSTLAGAPGQSGSADGAGPAARFRYPWGVAVDGAGNLYVADTGNHTIRRITPAGAVSTLAGAAGQSGIADGAGPAARFNYPRGVTVDGSGNVYVADTGNHTIRKVTAAGVVSTLTGMPGQIGSADGAGPAARFHSPYGVAVDGSANLYVADGDNHTIRKVTAAGVVSTLAGTAGQIGSADGAGAAARFDVPEGVAVDGAGNVYVGDGENNTIRKVTPAADVSTLAGAARQNGDDDGIGEAARFFYPTGVAVDGAGNVYVADTRNHTIRKITPAGAVSTLAGSAGQAGSADGDGAAARFYYPSGVAVDGAGNLYVADTYNCTIRKIAPPASVTTLAGSAAGPGNCTSVDAAGIAARFNHPTGVAVDGAGNLYVADAYNCTIRKITPSANVTTLAGSAAGPGNCTSVDATGLAARLNYPNAVAVDGAGNLYVADTDGDAIRKVTPAGDVSTLAGTAGESGSDDGTGPAARFDAPHGLAVDKAGDVYVADTDNCTIRKITPAGVVTTPVGIALQVGTAAGPLPASLAWPTGLGVDPTTGNLFVTVPDALLQVRW